MTAHSAARGGKTFRHGIHPPENKEQTNALSIARMPFVDTYVIPLSQHIGAPARAAVKVGDDVLRGQLIAEPGGFVSTAHHAPVTGTVTAIELRLHPSGKMQPSIVIDRDPYADQRIHGFEPVDPTSLSSSEVIDRVQKAGLVGLGGAAFPSHVKLAVPEGKKVKNVVINGCECEPYLTCDHRMMVEQPEQIVRGTRIIMAQVGADKGYIGVELNKPDAIEALKAVAGPDIEIVPLVVKYPQGAEKSLIDSIFKVEVPKGKLPLELDLLVNNIATAAGLADLFDLGNPLIERVLTVTGPGVVQPKNLLVPIGTPLSAIIDYCGGLTKSAKQVVLGGPMMGMPQKSLDVPTLKGTSGILCLTKVAVLSVREYPCIKCGRCLDACPMFLNPTRLAQLVRKEMVDELESHHMWNCFECASCSYVCPSGIPLVQFMRMGKAMLRSQKAKKSS